MHSAAICSVNNCVFSKVFVFGFIKYTLHFTKTITVCIFVTLKLKKRYFLVENKYIEFKGRYYNC